MSNTLKAFQPYQKFVIALLALLQFTVVLDFMILSPLGDILMKSLAITPAQFSKVVSAYAFSAGISGILAAGFADRFDRKSLLIFFYIGFILGTILCAVANTYELLFFARIVTGIFGGVISSITLAIVTDLFALNQRGRVMSMIQMAFAGSQILGIPLGLFFAAHWNWNASFYFIVGICILAFAGIIFGLKPITEHLSIQNKDKAILHLYNTFRKRNYRIGFTTTAMLSVGGFMLMPFSTAFLVNNVNISNEQLPYIFFVTGLSSMFIMPIIGNLSDKYSKLHLFGIGSFIALFMISIYTNLGPVSMYTVMVINVLLFVGLLSRMVPATALTSAIPELKDRGAFMSINASLQQMAGGIASIIAGLVVVQASPDAPLEHFNTVGYITGVFLLICVWFMWRVNKLVQNQTEGEKPLEPIPGEIPA
jgi:predicted MFS family arabinose efflux permease